MSHSAAKAPSGLSYLSGARKIYYKINDPRDERLVRSVLHFYSSRDISLHYLKPIDVIGESYLAFCESRKKDPGISDHALIRDALKRISSLLKNDSQYEKTLQKIRDGYVDMKDLEPSTFGERLQQQRIAHHKTLSQLAAELNVGLRAVISWEQDEKMPRPRNLSNLATTFKTSVSSLLMDMSSDELAKAKVPDIGIPDIRSNASRKLVGIKVATYRKSIGKTQEEFLPGGVLLRVERGQSVQPWKLPDIAKEMHTTVSSLLTSMPLDKLLSLKVDNEFSGEGKKIIGLKLAILRITSRFKSQLNLAMEIQRPKSLINYWESGEHLIGPNDLKKLVDVFNDVGAVQEEICGKVEAIQILSGYKKIDFLRQNFSQCRKYKLLLLSTGLWRKDLAEKLGVPCSKVYQWVSGESKPDMVNEGKMAKIFGVTLDFKNVI